MALLTLDEVAARLGTTNRHVRNLQYLHGLPTVKVGHLVRVDETDLDAWIDARRRVKL